MDGEVDMEVVRDLGNEEMENFGERREGESS